MSDPNTLTLTHAAWLSNTGDLGDGIVETTAHLVWDQRVPFEIRIFCAPAPGYILDAQPWCTLRDTLCEAVTHPNALTEDIYVNGGDITIGSLRPGSGGPPACIGFALPTAEGFRYLGIPVPLKVHGFLTATYLRVATNNETVDVDGWLAELETGS